VHITYIKNTPKLVSSWLICHEQTCEQGLSPRTYNEYLYSPGKSGSNKNKRT